jgi:hypothetical protein
MPGLVPPSLKLRRASLSSPAKPWRSRVPGIYVYTVSGQDVDGRDKPGHDEPMGFRYPVFPIAYGFSIACIMLCVGVGIPN